MSRKPRIAWFSDCSLRGDESGTLSAWVSRRLLPHLGRYDIELFSSSAGTFDGRPVQHFLSAFKRHEEAPFDAFVYQFEDRKECFFVRAHLALMPGIVWFHDFFLTSDGPEPLLNSPWEETVRKFNDPARPWAPHDAEYTRPKPQAYREAASALVPVFSSIRDHDEYRRVAAHRLAVAGAQSWHLPVPVECGTPARGEGALLYCGSPRIEDRAHKILEALRAARGGWKLVWLLEREDAAAARELVEEFGVTEVELIEGRTPERWQATLSHGAAALHTHFSAYGHVQPWLNLSLAAGIPVVVSDFAESALLPAGIAFQVTPGNTEAHEIAMVLDRIRGRHPLTEVPPARAYAQEHCDPRAVASEFSMLLEQSLPVLSAAAARWKALEADARRALVAEVAQGDESGIIGAAFTELGWGI